MAAYICGDGGGEQVFHTVAAFESVADLGAADGREGAGAFVESLAGEWAREFQERRPPQDLLRLAPFMDFLGHISSHQEAER